MRPGCFMASVDLKDAYYSVPMAEDDRQLFEFEWEGNYFQFTCLPNRLASAPRLFTKSLKPVYASLRSLGHFCMGHIDDSFLMGYNYASCGKNILQTVNILHVSLKSPGLKFTTFIYITAQKLHIDIEILAVCGMFIT